MAGPAELLKINRGAVPLFRGYVGDGLGKGPAMAGEVLGIVLALTWRTGMMVHGGTERLESISTPREFHMDSSRASSRAPRTNLDFGAAGLFECMGELQDAGFAEGRTEDLQAHGQLAVNLSAGHGNSRDARERSRNRIDVGKIHLERVAGAFAQFEGWNGRSGREDRVHFGEGIAKILGDERADFLPLQIVGVVVAGGEDVGAKDDAALYFGTEARAARFAIAGK